MGAVVNQSLPSLYGGSLDITRTVPSSCDFRQFSELMISDVFLGTIFHEIL